MVVLLCFVSVAVSAQGKRVEASDLKEAVRCEQWQVVDLVYQVDEAISKPFGRQAHAVVKGGPTEQRVPLFFNGGSEWVFRYSSATTGKRSFVLESDIAELDGLSGAFEVRPNTKADRHGGVVLKESHPNRFFYEDGTHYFNLAFECDWLFALDYGDAGIEKTEHLLSLLNQYGFNQVVMNVYSYDVSWPKDERLLKHPEHEYGGREDIFPFLGANSDPDFSALNVDFFKHFDKVVAAMHEREIVNHLMIYVWNKLVSWPDMASDADNMYYDYVIKRYQAFPNIVWDVSKEALHHERATAEYISERIARARALDAYGRLISVHDYGFCRTHADEVDFISMQNWKQTLYQHMLEAGRAIQGKPIFNIEHGGYEQSPYVVFPGGYTDSGACLRRNYICLFAGGYTTYYWQGASWNALIHNPFEQPADFVKPKFEYFKHMRTLFDTVGFENMEPAPNANNTGYCLINKKDGVVLMYAPQEVHAITARGAMKGFDATNATQQWFNTWTGEFSEIEPYDTRRLHHYRQRLWRGEADTILVVRNLKPANG